MKTCRKCGEPKPLDEFYAHKNMADGRLSKCKCCAKQDAKAYREASIERYRAYDRGRSQLEHRRCARSEYQQSDRGRERCMAARRAYLERNPEKRAAHIITWNAIRDGVLIRQPCEECGEPRAEAHHDDYSKPLDVRWLCGRHHRQHHAALRAAQRGNTHDQEHRHAAG